MQLEPRSCSPEWAVASKIRNGRQVSALNIRRFLHPTRIVSNVLYPLRPVACQLWGEALGFIFHAPVPNVGQMSKSAYRTRAELETAGFPGSIQLNLANTALGRRNFYAVDGQVGEPRFRTANLHVLAFTLVALQRDPRQAANSVSDIRIRKAGDHLGRQNIENVVSNLLLVDRLGFAVGTLGRYDDTLGVRADRQNGRHIRRLPGNHSDGCLKCREADIGDLERIDAWGYDGNTELPLSVRNSSQSLFLQYHGGPGQDRATRIGNGTVDPAGRLLCVDRNWTRNTDDDRYPD